MPVSALQTALLGKIEATPGVDAAPAAATDAIRVISAQLKVDAAPLDVEQLKPTFGKGVGPVHEQSLTLDVEFYVRGSGTLGAAPDWGPIAHAAGNVITANAGVSVSIDPITALQRSSTFYFYEDGLVWKLIGAQASGFTIEAPLDGYLRAKATLIAPYAAPVAAALPAGLAFQTSDPVKVKPSDVITDAGAAIKVGSFSFDAGIAARVRQLIGGADTVFDGRDRPKITLTKESLGTVADYTRLTGLTKGAFSAQFGAAGNRITISAPNASYGSVAPGRDNAVMQREIELWLEETTAGDDAYRILID